jgi:hypothetical protein
MKYRIIQEGNVFYPQKKSFLFWEYIPNIEFWLNHVGGLNQYNYSPRLQAVCFSYEEALRQIEKHKERKPNKKRIIHNL